MRLKLEELRRGRRVSVRLAERAAIVLHAADGLEDQEIGRRMGITRQKAGRWRKRYAPAANSASTAGVALSTSALSPAPRTISM